MHHFNRSGGSGHGPEKGTFLAQDEASLLRKAEVGSAFTIGLEPRAVGFVGGEAVERNQPIADVVGALMRHPIAEEISAALGNDGEPSPGVFFEGVALKRIELVADEDRDAHGSLLAVSWDRLPHPATSCRVAWRACFGYYRTMLAVASHVALVAAASHSKIKAWPARLGRRRRGDRRPRRGRAGRRGRSDSVASRRARP